MTGETWRSQWEIASEVTPGTSVPSTRLMYFDEGGKLTRTRAARLHKFSTGGRQNQLAKTSGPEMVAGNVAMDLSASEIIELLLMGVSAGITPTRPDSGGNPTVYLWTFKPGSALQAATMRWDDAARPWTGAGMYANKLKIAGNVNSGNKVTADLFGFKLTQAALTGGLTPRTPDFIEGWETKLYIDALGATPGTTPIAGTLINWDIEINNNLTRKFWADNVNAAEGIVPGEIGITAKLTFEASQAQALTEYNDWDTATGRLLRLEFGQNSLISGAYKKFVTLDLPGAWGAVDLGQVDAGTRAYQFSLDYLLDSANVFGLQIRAQNSRAAAWA